MGEGPQASAMRAIASAEARAMALERSLLARENEIEQLEARRMVRACVRACVEMCVCVCLCVHVCTCACMCICGGTKRCLRWLTQGL